MLTHSVSHSQLQQIIWGCNKLAHSVEPPSEGFWQEAGGVWDHLQDCTVMGYCKCQPDDEGGEGGGCVAAVDVVAVVELPGIQQLTQERRGGGGTVVDL